MAPGAACSFPGHACSIAAAAMEPRNRSIAPMDKMARADQAMELTGDARLTAGLGRRTVPHGPLRRVLRGFIHFFSYHLILNRRSTRVTRAAGFRLTVR